MYSGPNLDILLLKFYSKHVVKMQAATDYWLKPDYNFAIGYHRGMWQPLSQTNCPKLNHFILL